MNKALISVTGTDRTGIIAKVSTALYDMNVNIMDISQTILSGYFTMLMVVDLGEMDKRFQEIVLKLDEIGEEIGVLVNIQRMDIFNAMHKI